MTLIKSQVGDMRQQLDSFEEYPKIGLGDSGWLGLISLKQPLRYKD